MKSKITRYLVAIPEHRVERRSRWFFVSPCPRMEFVTTHRKDMATKFDGWNEALDFARKAAAFLVGNGFKDPEVRLLRIDGNDLIPTSDVIRHVPGSGPQHLVFPGPDR